MPPGPVAEVRPLALARRALWSLIGLGCGVAVSATVMVSLGRALESSTHGWAWSLRASFFVVGYFALPVWLLAMLPMSLFAPRAAPAFRRGQALVFGVLCGIVGAFFEMLAVSMFYAGLGAGFLGLGLGLGALVGGVAWSVFAALVRYGEVPAPARRGPV